MVIGKPTVSNVSGFSPTPHRARRLSRHTALHQQQFAHVITSYYHEHFLSGLHLFLPKPIRQKQADFPLLCGVY